MNPFEYVRHPRVETRRAEGPVKVADQHPTGTGYARFNAWLATCTTAAVGSMTCAYLFTAIALISLPAAIASGNVIVIVSWFAQTLVQLVLLSVIMVGQQIQGAAADRRAEATYADAEAVLHESAQIQTHLLLQDDRLEAQNQVLAGQTATLQAIVAHLTGPA